ncbi:acyl-CoA synthetase (AMP-forming)/AMP-acid ligase II [Undibacterium sp. GrIS 1.2]
MRLQAVRTDDLACGDSVHEQGVGDQRAVAAPGYRFGAHQRDAVISGELDDTREVRGEIGRLHVVGITTKRRVALGGVGRVRCRRPKAAEAACVGVPDVRGGQRRRQGILVELWVVARARHGANIDQLRDAVGDEQLNERPDGPGRVADGQHAAAVFIVVQ